MIKNSTRKTIISNDYELLETKLSQAIGLMFLNRPRCLLFDFKKEKRISLHMFFVFFPIDVLFIDNEKKVVEIKENFKPFSFYKSKSDKVRYIIELPLGSIEDSDTKIDDRLEFD